MLSVTLLCAAFACLVLPGQTATVKRRRYLDDLEMLNDFRLDDDEGSAVYDYTGMEEMPLYFLITYDKEFNDDLLDTKSDAFWDEKQLVKKQMEKHIALNLGVVKDDVNVEVEEFTPGSTKAKIEVRIPEYYRYTEEEVSRQVRDLEGIVKIGESMILDIEELQVDFPLAEAEKEAIILELTYDYDISDGSVDLTDDTSDDFANEALALRQQLTLHLVNNLAYQGVDVDPEQITIHVLSFVSDGTYTKAEISVLGENIDIELLSYVLQVLVIDDSVHINGRPIISLEELERAVPFDEDYPEMDEKVMMEEEHDDFLNGFEDPDFLDEEDDNDLLPSMEVMPEKEGLNGMSESVPDDEIMPLYDGEEPTPPAENVVVPDLESIDEPVPPDDESAPPSDSESVPPDDESEPIEVEPTPPDNVEPTPPDNVEPTPPDNVEPTPPDARCPVIRAPDRGSMDCFNGREIGSQCQFLCDDETRMEGTDTTFCNENGKWTFDAPYCERILCQPSTFRIRNGKYSCTHEHAFQSVCTFMCKNDEFQLIGERILMCQRNESWTSEPPTCEPIPVNCEEEYGPWLECSNGKRIKAAITVRKADIDTLCPEVSEVCIDCQLEWGAWGSCDEADMRYRSQYVGTEKVGAGKECAEPRVDRQQCRKCVLDWEEWTPCESNSSSRRQYIEVTPVGNYECPPLEEETQDCFNCLVGWGEWGECVGNVVKRSQEIIQEALNGGQACPELKQKSEVCSNCVVEWLPWSACVEGITTRVQMVVKESSGRGAPCPRLGFDEKECQNCEVEWPAWPECEGGVRVRTQVVVVEQKGEGAACPALKTDSEICVHCEMEWGDWEACIAGQRRRTQFIAVEPEGAGDSCPDPELEFKDCANCEVDWGEWGECLNGERIRSQYISQEPIEVDEPCPLLQEQTEPCSDCVFTWSEWSECFQGKQNRFLLVEMESVGAGRQCPEEQVQTRECCYLEWTPWSECEDGVRSRHEEVIVEPEGEFCREPKAQVQDCADCILEWGEWSECINNNVQRMQRVVQDSFGGGNECPELDIDSQYCANCIVDWDDWGPCGGGVRERQQYVFEERIGRGKECPDLEVKSEECYHCEWRWTPWTECENGGRNRFMEILQPPVGAGDSCPDRDREFERCVDCVVEWGEWTDCTDGERSRTQHISIQPEGAGEECPELLTDFQTCVDCVIAWQEWSECSNDQRTRKQYIVTEAEGAGKPCPPLGMASEPCIDCVIEWGSWSLCYNGIHWRKPKVVVEPVGAGKECPALVTETKDCGDNNGTDETVVCRFAEKVLGYKRPPFMRDLLLIGDESGSIGWLNFEKIKVNFKSIAKNIRGGIGSQETQIAMSSFSLFSRTVFDFDDHRTAEDMIDAIDQSYFKGGYRSRIGEALSDANVWLFQQTGGMRSFPDVEDNIVHEILIATDGCRTSDVYHLQQGLKVIKDRGIKLYVLGIKTPDARCRKTVESMVEDKDDLFLVGSWDELDQLTVKINEKVCFFGPSAEGDGEDEVEVETGEGEDVEEEVEVGTEEENVVEEEEEEEAENEIPEPIEGSRGDSAGI